MNDLLLLGVRRLRGQPTRIRGPYDTRLLTGRDSVLRGARLALTDTNWERGGSRRAGFTLAVFDGRRVHELRSGIEQVRDDSPVPALLRLVWHLDDPALSAAAGLASLCELIAATDPTLSGPDFVVRLAEQAAGIRPGRPGWADLVRAGDNRLPGGGFREEYDDGTLGQVRHFAGSCAATLRLGSRATGWASVLRGDLRGGGDHRLTGAAVDFTRDLTSGALAPADAGEWVRTHLLPPPAG